ncbi:Gfo/Idh/MocA family oxidoreductase [Alteromonadaceae bacterium BrNp21-10]|nr:Gfo/Idh/MocA family oxidoreductase [Alteromonadaceae bacterium BrNp21-10]
MQKIQATQINWGIIGVGDVCEVKSAPAMNLIENSQLLAVMRRNGALAKDYAQRHYVPKWYDDADALIADPDINAIYIATPPDAHMPMVLKAAAAGKAVYVEKPMARNHAECLNMIEHCQQTNVPLYVAYYRRCLPHFVKVKSIIEEGIIGDVRHVNIRLNQSVAPQLLENMDNHWRVNAAISGGGYFHDLASHQLDFLDYALGPIQQAQGIITNQAGHYQAPDMVSASFQFESGVIGTGSWCFNSGTSAQCDITEIIGSKGRLQYPSFGAGEVHLETDTQGKQLLEFPLPKHIQQPLIQTIVDDLLGQGTCPSSGISAARTNWVMEQICG